MVRPEGGFIDLDGALVGGFGPGVVAQVLQHPAQVVDVCCYLRMVRPEGGFIDFQGALVGGFGPGVVAQVLQHPAQVVDANSDVGVVRPEGGFVNFHGALVGGFGPGIIAQVFNVIPQTIPKTSSFFNLSAFCFFSYSTYMRQDGCVKSVIPGLIYFTVARIGNFSQASHSELVRFSFSASRRRANSASRG